MKYKFKWKKTFFWKSLMVIGHKYEKEFDKMVLYLEDGSIREISKWSGCEVFLGKDWVIAVKKQMEKDSGLQISLNVKEKPNAS